MPITIRDICSDAAKEIGVIGQGDPFSAADAVDIRNLLRRLLNSWNTDRRAVYATAFLQFTLVPNPSGGYITIGPSGQFAVTQRPVSIDGANLILTPSTPPVQTPINIRDAQWWLSQTTQTLTSTYPTDLYYQPDWPLGKLYFWPVPTTAYDVQLMTRVVLDDTVDFNDTYSLPPGYQNAITLSLAEMATRPFERDPIPTLIRDAALARALVFGSNDVVPRIDSMDTGMMPGRSGNRADFNWLSGQVVTSRGTP